MLLDVPVSGLLCCTSNHDYEANESSCTRPYFDSWIHESGPESVNQCSKIHEWFWRFKSSYTQFRSCEPPPNTVWSVSFLATFVLCSSYFFLGFSSHFSHFKITPSIETSKNRLILYFKRQAPIFLFIFRQRPLDTLSLVIKWLFVPNFSQIGQTKTIPQRNNR